MKKETMLKVISLSATLIATGASLLQGYVNEQKLNDRVDEKVAETLKQLLIDSKKEI